MQLLHIPKVIPTCAKGDFCIPLPKQHFPDTRYWRNSVIRTWFYHGYDSGFLQKNPRNTDQDYRTRRDHVSDSVSMLITDLGIR